jgi:uncharacterized protein YggU (UPF0235/DUF167 family)
MPRPTAPWAEAIGETFVVRVTPKASADRVTVAAPEGADAGAPPEVRVAVTAAPEDGKANAAVLKILAKAMGLPRSRLSIVRGETARVKTIRVDRSR